MTIDDLRRLLSDDPWSGTQETARGALLAALDVVEATRTYEDTAPVPQPGTKQYELRQRVARAIDAFEAALESGASRKAERRAQTEDMQRLHCLLERALFYVTLAAESPHRDGRAAAAKLGNDIAAELVGDGKEEASRG